MTGLAAAILYRQRYLCTFQNIPSYNGDGETLRRHRVFSSGFCIPQVANYLLFIIRGRCPKIGHRRRVNIKIQDALAAPATFDFMDFS